MSSCTGINHKLAESAELSDKAAGGADSKWAPPRELWLVRVPRCAKLPETHFPDARFLDRAGQITALPGECSNSPLWGAILVTIMVSDCATRPILPDYGVINMVPG